ncbi:MAG: bifunctional glutamate N-acetyltransferase/amino-acid acetyltransferase ArgJ [Pseudomonadales bacterium]|nr:bifunctional glutamate N-acetyltransferase/amino-acid acetyltransferase ArgJ [Pseudomonadales bacterium]
MPVGDAILDWLPIEGVEISTLASGIRYEDREDLVLFRLSERAEVAAIFTQNYFPAAPVTVAKAHLAQGQPRYLLINTGNANAATGDQGIEDALSCCALVADAERQPVTSVLPFSTGVIGERLPLQPFSEAMPQLIKQLGDQNWHDAATAIMTTDTRPKIACRSVAVGEQTVQFTGIAKGAGMIQPNMATMLCFIACDANVDQGLLQEMLRAGANQSFNRITVDSDTSTNDACLLVATGSVDLDVESNLEVQTQLQDGLTDIMLELAQGLVRDGEGATKFVTVQVDGASSEAQALEVAFSIANSPLMKTALFASDANWGRLAMAVGKAKIPIDPNRVDLFIGDVCLMHSGVRDPQYQEVDGARAVAGAEVLLRVNLNLGEFSETVWTSDLSHEYIRINAEYRT